MLKCVVDSIIKITEDEAVVGMRVTLKAVIDRWLKFYGADQLTHHSISLHELVLTMLQMHAYEEKCSPPQHEAVCDGAFVADEPVFALSYRGLLDLLNFFAQIFLHENGDEHLIHPHEAINIIEAFLCQELLYLLNPVGLIHGLALLRRYYDDIVLLCISD